MLSGKNDNNEGDLRNQVECLFIVRDETRYLTQASIGLCICWNRLHMSWKIQRRYRPIGMSVIRESEDEPVCMSTTGIQPISFSKSTYRIVQFKNISTFSIYRDILIYRHIFTVRRYALHGLCDRNSVRLSVRPFDTLVEVILSVTLARCNLGFANPGVPPLCAHYTLATFHH